MYNTAIYLHMCIHMYNTAIYMYICMYMCIIQMGNSDSLLHQAAEDSHTYTSPLHICIYICIHICTHVYTYV